MITIRAGVPLADEQQFAFQSMSTEPTKRLGTSHTDAYDLLLAALREHSIAPGAPIKETETARALGTSRTPLREALNRLLAEGFVTLVPNYGFFARILDAHAAHNYFELRRIVELTVLHLAITKASEEAMQTFARTWLEILEKLPASESVSLELDETFHLGLATLSENREASVCLERLHAHLHALRLAVWNSEKHSSTAYVELIGALTSRRRAAAMRALSTMLGLDYPPSALNDPTSIPDVTAFNVARPRRKSVPAVPAQAVSEKAYRIIKAKIISFEFRPGERLSEQALAESVNASRATVREVLVRLAGERLTVWRPNLGFSIRTLDPIEMFELYELRAGLEAQAVAIAIERGSDSELQQFQADWQQSLDRFETFKPHEHVYQDEEFHRRLLKITRNEALTYELTWISARIHFVRGVDLRQQSGEWLDEHSRIAAAMVARDAKAASMLMQAHLARLMDDLRATLKIGIGELYIG